MNEKKMYIVPGEPEPYSVSLENEEQFLKDHPNAALQTQPESTDLVDTEYVNNSQEVSQPQKIKDIFNINLSDNKLDFTQNLNLNSDNESLQKLDTILNENLEKIESANSSKNNILSLDNLGYEEGVNAKASITNHPNSLLIHNSYKYNDNILDPWQRKAITKTKGELDVLEQDLKKLNEDQQSILKDRIPVEERLASTFEKFDEIMLKPTDDENIIKNRYFSKNVFNQGSVNLLSQINLDEPSFGDEDYQKSRATWQSAIQEDKEKTLIAEEKSKDKFVDLKYEEKKDKLENEIINKKENLQKNYLNKYQLEQYEGLPIDEFSDFGSGYFGEPLMDKGLRIKNIRGTTSAMPGTKTLSELGMFDVPTTDKIKDQTKREKYDTLWETAENDNWMGYGSEEELIKNIRTYSETEVPKKGESLSPWSGTGAKSDDFMGGWTDDFEEGGRAVKTTRHWMEITLPNGEKIHFKKREEDHEYKRAWWRLAASRNEEQKVDVNFDHTMYNHKGEPMQSNADYNYEDLTLLMETYHSANIAMENYMATDQEKLAFEGDRKLHPFDIIEKYKEPAQIINEEYQELEDQVDDNESEYDFKEDNNIKYAHGGTDEYGYSKHQEVAYEMKEKLDNEFVESLEGYRLENQGKREEEITSLILENPEIQERVLEDPVVAEGYNVYQTALDNFYSADGEYESLKKEYLDPAFEELTSLENEGVMWNWKKAEDQTGAEEGFELMEYDWTEKGQAEYDILVNKFDAIHDEVYQETIGPVLTVFNDINNAALFRQPEIKEIDLRYGNQFEEHVDKAWVKYIEDWAGDISAWDPTVLDQIASNFEKGGIDNMHAHAKRNLLDKTLDQHLSLMESDENWHGWEPGEKDELMKQYYYFFFDKLGTTVNKKTGERGASRFYSVQLAKEIEKYYNDPDWEANMDKEILAEMGLESTDDMKTGDPLKFYAMRLNRIMDRTNALDFTEDILSAPEFKEDMGNVGWYGLTAGDLDDLIPVYNGVHNWTQKYNIKQLAKKDRKDLTYEEGLVLASHTLKQQIDGETSEMGGYWYNTMKGAREMIPVVGEFILTSPAFFTAKAATTSMFSNNLLKTVQKTYPNARLAKNGKDIMFVKKGTVSKLDQYSIDFLSTIAGIGAQNTTQFWRIGETQAEMTTPEMILAFSFTDEDMNIIDEYTHEGEKKARISVITGASKEGKEMGLEDSAYGEGEAFVRSWMMNFIETGTERLGAQLPGISKKIFGGKKLNQLFDRTPFKILNNERMWKKLSIGHYMRKTGKDKSSMMKWFKDNAGYNGFSGEYLEELVAMPATNLADGRGNTWDGIIKYDESGNDIGWDWTSLSQLAIQTSMMTGTFNGINAAAKTLNRKSIYYKIDGKSFKNKEAALKRLESLQSEGLLTKDTKIKTNNYEAFDLFGNYLEENGLSSKQIQLPKVKSKFSSKLASEIDVLNKANDQQRKRLDEIDSEYNELNWVENQTSEVIKRKRELDKQRTDLLQQIKGTDNIIKEKNTKLYQETLRNVKTIIEQTKDKTDKNQLDIIEGENSADVETKVLEYFGIKKEGTNFIDIKTGEVITELKGKDEKGKDVSISVDKLLHNLMTEHGAIIPSSLTPDNRSVMILNEDIAVGKGGANVASHEFFHFFLNNAMNKNPELKLAMGNIFMQYLKDIDPRLIRDSEFRKRLNSYSNQDAATQSEEAMALFLDAIATNSVPYSEGIMAKIGDILRYIAKKFGYEFKLNSGKDVYKFLQDFNASIQRGELSKDQLNQFENGLKFGSTIKETAEAYKKYQEEQREKVINNIKSKFSSPESKVSTKDAEEILDLLENIGAVNFSLTEKTQKIVNKNDDIFEQVLESAEKKGIPKNKLKDAVTQRIKDALIVNNLPIAMDLAKKAFRGGQDAGTKKVNLEDWQAEYMLELTEMARTWNPNSNPKFGAYVNGFLPLRYGQILGKLKGEGPQTVSMTQLEQAGFDVADVDAGQVGGPAKISKGEFIADKVNIQKSDIKEVTNAADLSSLKKSPTYKKVKSLTKNGSLTPVLKVFGDKFGVPVEKLSGNKDLNGEQRDIARKAISSISKNNKLIDLLPDGTDASGKSTGIANTKFGEFYMQGDKVTMAQTGSAAGLAVQVKNENTTNQDFFDLFGMDAEGKSVKKGTEFDGAIREFVIQLASLAANQQIRTDRPGFETIKSGKPKIMFSKAAQKWGNMKNTFHLENGGGIDVVLKVINKGKVTYNIKTDKGRAQFIDNIKTKLFPLFPKEFFFTYNKKGNVTADIFTASHSNYGNFSMSTYKEGKNKGKYKNPEEAKIYNKFRNDIRALANTEKFGKPINGVNWNLTKTYSTIFGKKGNYKQKIKEGIESGDIKRWNNNVAIIHGEMWKRFVKAIRKDKTGEAAQVIGTYLKLTANDKQSWHRLGAQLVGYSKDINTRKNGKPATIEFEHAMPATAAYLYLMESAIDTDMDFNASYDLVVDNYKLIILDKAMDDKLRHATTKAGFSLQRRMPDGWSPIDGDWWQRYFNDIVPAIDGGINPESIIMLDGRTMGQTFNINASGGIKNSKTATEINNAQTIDKAFRNVIQYSKTGESRGMSTFDFDDTLAKTKSGIRYTIPNIDGVTSSGRKVIFLAGSAGSGKSNVVKQLGLEGKGFKIVNQDIALEWLAKNSGLPTDMRDFTPEQASKWSSLQWEARDIAQRKAIKFRGRGDGVIVDGTGASTISMFTQAQKYEDAGYDVQMLFVDSSLETALERNKARKERSLRDGIVKRNWKAVQKNKKAFKEEFGDNFTEVNTDNLKQGDPMPNSLVSKINKFTDSYIKGRLTAEEFASRGDQLLQQGAKFDFSEFNKVVDGTPGPLLDKARERAKKYGTDNMFVLTARPQASAFAIQQFLKGQGLDIPIENITGLANSTGEAKAQWMLEKFAEGYNDMYFVDDAYQNVKAVQSVLNQLDIKSEVVQAKIKFSKTASNQFNEILERKKGIDAEKVFSSAEARKRGAQPDIVRFIKSLYIPPSAEDFKGLLYYFLDKGKQGDADMKFFTDNLLKPFAEGIRAWNTYKQNMVNDYDALKKQFPKIKLNNKVPGTSFTNDTAIRVYLWTKAGFEIPGISKKLQKTLYDAINKDSKLKAFAEGLSIVTKRKDGYSRPGKNWVVESIPTDLQNVVDKIGRKEFLQEWIENKDIIFSSENLNKIRALYGDRFIEALEDILYRMENGGHRSRGKDSDVNWFTNWINGSVGTIMFFNMRSALLQTISTVNFINWSDNNIFKASAAFANQPQFWKDFVMLFNSDQLKQRRTGLQTDVSASELTKTFAERGYSPGTVINYLLQKGFKPTQIADSFAIAFGGATFYRNRYKKYIKEGMSSKQANEQTMLDFQEIAEETQQSSREDLISQQQASVLGRLVLAFQNVTMQYGRLTKKALSDLVNRRGDWKTNVSKIVYYGMAQNVVFSALQNALAFMVWGGDEEEIDDKTTRTFNSALDSFLRGTGLYGALVSTLKNTIIQWNLQKEKPWGKERIEKIALEVVNLSPPIGSKVRKIVKAYYADAWNEDLSEELGFRIENPQLTMAGNIIEALFNVPIARVQNKANNLEEAITGNHETWKRVMLALGWSQWELGIKDEEVEAAKERITERKEIEKEKEKEEKKIEKKKEKEEEKKKEEEEKKAKGIKTVRCSGIRSNGERCGNTTETADKTYLCYHHAEFTDGMDRDNDGIKEYRCTATKKDGNRCKNKTENKNKKCYAHQ